MTVYCHVLYLPLGIAAVARKCQKCDRCKTTPAHEAVTCCWLASVRVEHLCQTTRNTNTISPAINRIAKANWASKQLTGAKVVAKSALHWPLITRNMPAGKNPLPTATTATDSHE